MLVLLEWENNRVLFSARSAYLAGMGKQLRFILSSLHRSRSNRKTNDFYPLIIALTRPHIAIQTKTALMQHKSSFEERI
ncbi:MULTISPECIES: hypothetical protein [unclassified Oceanobacillus]|uniref:hypothetical protein n=1 Tax=unclassified Oceanobacillus TaxID=2630292 RepID=UPI00300E20FD